MIRRKRHRRPLQFRVERPTLTITKAGHRVSGAVPAVTALLLGLQLTVSGCGDPRLSYDASISRGLAAYQDGRYPEAVDAFKCASERDRERPEPAYYMGRCHLAMARQQATGDYPLGALRHCDRAIASFDDAIEAFPGFSDAVQGKADALRLKGRHAAALEVADWAVKHSGSQAKKLIHKGHLYAQAGDMDQAQLAFKQATSVEPDNAAMHAELGLFYWRCGNEREAVRCLRRAYELNPGTPGVVTALAQLGALSDPPGER